MHDIWRVFRYTRFYPWNIAANLLFNMLAVVFNLFTFVTIVPFIELIFGSPHPAEALPPFSLTQEYLSLFMTHSLAVLKARHGQWACLLGFAMVYLAFSFLSNLCRYAAQFVISPMRNGIVMRLRDDLYHKITILPVSFFNSRRRGDILSRMSNDLSDIEWGVLTSIISLGKDPVTIIIFAAVLIFISPRLFLYFLIIMPIAVWLIGIIGRSLRRSAVKGQAGLGHLFAILEEYLSGIRTVKAFAREADATDRFDRANSTYAHRMVHVATRRELSSPLSEILLTVGLVFILILGGLAVLQGELLSSVFVLFVILFARLVPPVQSIVRVYNNLQKANAAATRIFEIMDADETIIEKDNPVVLQGFNSAIQYRNVSFAYRTDSHADPVYVLRNIDLDIPCGQTIAIVGPSGAGKTTLVDLLPRFYDSTQGDILIDGHPVRDLNINSLRAQIGLVSQDCILFNDTVANNIAFGRTDHSPEQVRRAATVAHADEFITQLPQGYDTNIGDSGITLSGGQRQRLSIARAVLKNPPILILDEATSALDTESEMAVQQALNQLMQGRTCIVIAHRLSTIRHADLIIVMDHGVIVERGTHDQLIAQNGLYRRLVDMQSFR